MNKVKALIKATQILQDCVANKTPNVIKAKLSHAISNENKQVVEYIVQALNLAVQCNASITTRFNINALEDLDELDELLNRVKNNDVFTFGKTPFTLQLYIKYCSNNSAIHLSKNQLYDLLGNRLELIDKPNNICFKCGVKTANTLCDKCKEDLHTATEFRSESFDITGSALLPFKYSFLDWEVDVTQLGRYRFTRKPFSDTQYQPKLPFVEYQQNLQLL